MCVQKSFFGKPENFGGGQLPTYRQVGRQFLQTKKDLQAQNLGTKILDHDVAKQVKQIFKRVKKCIYSIPFQSIRPSVYATTYLNVSLTRLVDSQAMRPRSFFTLLFNFLF